MPADAAITKLGEIPILAFKDREWTAREFFDYLRLRDQQADFRRFALDKIVEEEARSRDLSVSDDELGKAAEDLRLERGLFQAVEFEAYLKSAGLSLEDFEKKTEASLLLQKLTQAVIAECDVERAFYENKPGYDRATISRIRVAEEGLAQEIACSVREKEATFESLAKQYNRVAQERFSGGFQGTFTRDDIDTDMEASIFNAKDGSVVGPVMVENEFHVVWVHEIVPAQLNPEIRAQIRESLFDEWLEQALKESGFRVLI
jgi:parvulin-like peptidyl-prolyl isomerase